MSYQKQGTFCNLIRYLQIKTVAKKRIVINFVFIKLNSQPSLLQTFFNCSPSYLNKFFPRITLFWGPNRSIFRATFSLRRLTPKTILPNWICENWIMHLKVYYVKIECNNISAIFLLKFSATSLGPLFLSFRTIYKNMTLKIIVLGWAPFSVWDRC